MSHGHTPVPSLITLQSHVLCPVTPHTGGSTYYPCLDWGSWPWVTGPPTEAGHPATLFISMVCRRVLVSIWPAFVYLVSHGNQILPKEVWRVTSWRHFTREKGYILKPSSISSDLEGMMVSRLLKEGGREGKTQTIHSNVTSRTAWPAAARRPPLAGGDGNSGNLLS